MQSEGFSISDLEQFASRFYGGKPLLLVPYAYNTTFTGLSAGSTQTNTLNITANADFILLNFHHRASANLASSQNVSTKLAPYCRVTITDSGTNEQFTNSAVDLENYSTNGNIINMLPYPRIISGRSTLTIQLTNYDSSNAVASLDLMFEGVLVRAFSA